MSRLTASGESRPLAFYALCHDEVSQDVLCASKDCPIFYMRKKAQKDVEEAVSSLAKFVDETW